MKPIDYKDTKPQFILEDYFLGQVEATGVFEDRFGNVRRQFNVDIQGSWDGSTLTLEEYFVYDDGEVEERTWTLKKIDEHQYEGRAANVIGVANGERYGNAFNWRYTFDLNVGDDVWRVKFDDWMFLRPGGVVINRATVTRWGFEIGSVTLAFVKRDQIQVADRRVREGGAATTARKENSADNEQASSAR